MCTSGFRQQSSRRVPFRFNRLRLLATSPLITTTVDAEKPFTYLQSARFMANRIGCYTVNKARVPSRWEDNYAPFDQ